MGIEGIRASAVLRRDPLVDFCLQMPGRIGSFRRDGAIASARRGGKSFKIASGASTEELGDDDGVLTEGLVVLPIMDNRSRVIYGI